MRDTHGGRWVCSLATALGLWACGDEASINGLGGNCAERNNCHRGDLPGEFESAYMRVSSEDVEGTLQAHLRLVPEGSRLSPASDPEGESGGGDGGPDSMNSFRSVRLASGPDGLLWVFAKMSGSRDLHVYTVDESGEVRGPSRVESPFDAPPEEGRRDAEGEGTELALGDPSGGEHGVALGVDWPVRCADDPPGSQTCRQTELLSFGPDSSKPRARITHPDLGEGGDAQHTWVFHGPDVLVSVANYRASRFSLEGELLQEHELTIPDAAALSSEGALAIVGEDLRVPESVSASANTDAVRISPFGVLGFLDEYLPGEDDARGWWLPRAMSWLSLPSLRLLYDGRGRLALFGSDAETGDLILDRMRADDRERTHSVRFLRERYAVLWPSGVGHDADGGLYVWTDVGGGRDPLEPRLCHVDGATRQPRCFALERELAREAGPALAFDLSRTPAEEDRRHMQVMPSGAVYLWFEHGLARYELPTGPLEE